MLWLTPYPWARWAAAALIIGGSLWLELRPTATEPIPFATKPIAPGETIEQSSIADREVPVGLLEPADAGDIARLPIAVGDPVLASSVGGENELTPENWWVVTVPLPAGSAPGDQVRLVLLDLDTEVEGVVTSTGEDDPFGSSDGGVAVSGDHSAAVAMAAADGRLVVLVSAG